MTAEKRSATLLIEGAGDVVDNYYFPALRKLREKGQLEFDVTFSDSSAFWRGDLSLAEKMLGIRRSLECWGATYLDKNCADDLKRWEDLQPDVVVVATPDFTHSEVAAKWLKRDPERIFIEKPLDSSVDGARRLLGETRPYDSRVWAFDHYRARLMPARAKFDMLGGFLRDGLKTFTFYFLEDHSGADPNYAGAKNTRQGPIENDRRVKALQHGVILDLMPHVIAILAHFGRVETLRVTRVRPGKYEGVDGVPGKLSEIDCETFAEVSFMFEDHLERRVDGAAFVGKGVKGTTVLGPEHDRNTKFLRIDGKHGRRVDIDFRKTGTGASQARLLDEHGDLQLEFELNPDPYYTFLDHALNLDEELDIRLGLPVEIGKKVLEVIEDMRRPILDCIRNEGIASYPCGIWGVRTSPLLEDLTCRNPLPLVYGH
jgi:predicted dehydrogenase